MLPARHIEASGGAATTQPHGILLTRYGTEPTYFPGVVARYLPDTLSGTNAISSPPHTVSPLAGEWRTQGWFRAQEATSSREVLYESTFVLPGEHRKSVEYDGNTYFGNAFTCYDGEFSQETCPRAAPEGLSVSFGGSGSIAAGTYSYKAVWEWDDAAGNLHRSAPSAAASGTSGASKVATLTFNDLSGRFHDGTNVSNIRVALYRTQAGGSTYYLAKRSYPSAPSSGLVTITDDIADASLGEFLYTEGDELEANPPPPNYDMAIGKGRAFLINAERRQEVWYSKTLQRGIVPEFNAALTIDVPQGDATALAILDEKLIIFTADQVLVVLGDGPNVTGEGSLFAAPEVVSQSIGCINRNSVAVGSFGVVFQSRRGIFLLDRSMQVSFLGAAVDDELTAGVFDVLCATVVPEEDEVRFSVETSSANKSNFLVWNYVTGQWSRWGTFDKKYAATMWSGYHTVCDGGLPSRYSPTVSGDYSETGHEMEIKTGWIRFSGIQGFQRIRKALVRFEKTGTASLTVKYAVDYATSLTTLATFTNAELAAASGQVSVQLPVQKCQALQIYLASTGMVTNTGRIKIQGIAVEAGIKRGANKLPATSKK